MDAESLHHRRVINRRLRIAAVVLGLSVLAAFGWRVAGAVNSAACVSCHDSEEFESGTRAAAHADVPCLDCHAPGGTLARGLHGVRRSFHEYGAGSATTRREHARVSNDRCLACHSETMDRVLAGGDLRIDHSVCASGASCTDCHSSTGHGDATRWIRDYAMDACLECHVSASKTACDLCHHSRRVADRVGSPWFAASHVGEDSHGTGSVRTCTVCHPVDQCTECHGAGVPHQARFAEIHGSVAMGPDAKCSSCHDRKYCDSCHRTAMPHPADFTPRHSALAEREPSLCDGCHAESDCADCHVMHVHPGGAAGFPGQGR